MSKYTASEVIQLPRFTAVGAIALGERLLTAAKPVKKQLAKGVARVLAALASRHDDLASALRDQVSLSEGGEASEDAVQCDRVLDNCWSGLHDFLTAYTKLPPGAPEAAEASALKAGPPIASGVEARPRLRHRHRRRPPRLRFRDPGWGIATAAAHRG
jgi:hypothetical protein